MRRGFTLIEVIVSAGVLAVGCLGVLAMLLTSIDHNRESRDRTIAVTIAEQKLSELEILAKVGQFNLNTNNLGTWVAVSGNSDKNRFNNHGVNTGDGTKDRFSVWYVLLNDTKYAKTDGLRGGIRVVWNTTDTADNCAKVAPGNFDSRESRYKYRGCSFITLPFALYKEDITQ